MNMICTDPIRINFHLPALLLLVFMSISRVILRHVVGATCLYYRGLARGLLLNVPNKREHYLVLKRRQCDQTDLPHRRVPIDALAYETISEETLQSLGDYCDEILTISKNIKDADITYSSGVLTVNLGAHGIYVINKQTPNRQIWLSSPFSGPKRFDYIDNCWIYKHDGIKLHDLLNEEFRKILEDEVDFTFCSHANK